MLQQAAQREKKRKTENSTHGRAAEIQKEEPESLLSCKHRKPIAPDMKNNQKIIIDYGCEFFGNTFEIINSHNGGYNDRFVFIKYV